MKAIKVIVETILGIAIIGFLLYRLDIVEVISVLGDVNLYYFIIASFFYLGLNFLLAARLCYLLRQFGYRVNFPGVFFSHMGGMMVGDVTPGRSGYLLTPHFLNRNGGYRLTDGLACIFAPQGVEFVLKVAGAVIAVFYISSMAALSRGVVAIIGMGIVFLLIIGVFMLMVSWKNEDFSRRFFGRMPFLRSYVGYLASFKERSAEVKGSLDVILLIYFAGWFFAGAQWYFLGKALGIELSFLAFFLLHPLVTLLMFIPLTPAGLGFMEGGVVMAFSLLGVSPSIGLAFSVLARASILAVDILGLRAVLSSFYLR